MSEVTLVCTIYVCGYRISAWPGNANFCHAKHFAERGFSLSFCFVCIDYLPTSTDKGIIKGQKGKIISDFESWLTCLLDGVMIYIISLWLSYSLKILHKKLSVRDHSFFDVTETWTEMWLIWILCVNMSPCSLYETKETIHPSGIASDAVLMLGVIKSETEKVMTAHVHWKSTWKFKQVLTLRQYEVSEITWVMNPHKISN